MAENKTNKNKKKVLKRPLLWVGLICFSIFVCIGVGYRQEGIWKSEPEQTELAAFTPEMSDEVITGITDTIVAKMAITFHYNADGIYYCNQRVVHMDTEGNTSIERQNDLYSITDTITIVNEMPRFNQNDSSIANFNIGGATISRAGCVPCGLTTVLDHFLGTDWDPTKVATDLYNKGLYNSYYAGQFVNGVYNIIQTMSYVEDYYGIPEESTLDDNAMKEALKQGKVVCAEITNGTTDEFHFSTYAGYEVIDGVEYTYSYDPWYGASNPEGDRMEISALINRHINSSMFWGDTAYFNDACWYIFG